MSNKLQTMYSRAAALAEKLENLEREIAEMESAARRSSTLTKTKTGVIIKHANGNIVMVKRRNWGWDVYSHDGQRRGALIERDSRASVNDWRLALALGQVDL